MPSCCRILAQLLPLKGAARRKGKWMGGTPLLGYDVDGQSRLQVNEAEAAQVREIYALFVSNGSLEETLEEIARRGWRRKRRRKGRGQERGGRAVGGRAVE